MKEKIQITRIKFALTNDQRQELIDVANRKNPKHYLILKLLLESGMRASELANLAIPQINFTSCEIIIETRNSDRYVKEYKTKTRSGNRIIPITKDMSHRIRQQIKKRATGYVFESNKKGKFANTSITRIVNQYAKQTLGINKKIGAHALRRTYASYLMAKGIKIGDISKILGHKSIKTTLIYLYDIVDLSSFDEVRKVVSGMNKEAK